MKRHFKISHSKKHYSYYRTSIELAECDHKRTLPESRITPPLTSEHPRFLLLSQFLISKVLSIPIYQFPELLISQQLVAWRAIITDAPHESLSFRNTLGLLLLLNRFRAFREPGKFLVTSVTLVLRLLRAEGRTKAEKLTQKLAYHAYIGRQAS